MDSNLKRSIILENYSNPINRKLVEDKNYIKINAKNESCIDDLILMIYLEDNIIKDIVFDGEACAISISATSLMIKNLLNKNIKEALELIKNFENMINEKEYNKNLLEELNVYDEMYKQPNRKKCALLPFISMKKELTKY